MSSGNGDTNTLSYLEARVAYLEETNLRYMAILDMLTSSGDFQSELSRATEAGGIFSASLSQVKRLIPCSIAGCMDSLDDGTFELAVCEPEGSADLLRSEIDSRIMDGSFAWALNRNQALLIPCEDDRTLLMQAIGTRSRIRGMFVAFLPGSSAHIDAAALNALSITLHACAYSLESNALYSLLHEHSTHLEERVRQRTAELEEARILAEEANRAKSEFLANMSHELRTPMNAIMGITELMLDSGMNSSRQDEYLRMILSSSENLLLIINDLLDISKIEAGKMELQEAPFRLRDTLAKRLQPFVIRAAQKNLRVVLSVGEDVPDPLLGDEGKLLQVLINFVGNAIKFTSSGDITIDVDISHQLAGDLYLRFKVSDRGIGIAPDALDRIFQAFEQADSTTSKEFGGTGLGLAICKRLVAMIGGEIGVESQLQQGSTFWFTCRLRRVDTCGEELCMETQSAGETALYTDRPLTILLVDDVEFNRVVAMTMLERAGHRVVCACNGSEAIKCFVDTPFDAVLMDIQMPVMDGFQATRALRVLEEGTGRHVPIVALTAYASEDFRGKCAQAGMDGFLTKPFKTAEMLAVLGRCCGDVSEKNRSATIAVHDSGNGDGVGTDTIFDYNDLLARLGGRRETVSRFLELFRKGSVQQLAELAAAAESGAQDDLRKAAHSIKGAAANIAALKVSDTAMRIERKAREGRVQEAIELIPVLHEELDRFDRLSREMIHA